MEADIVKQQESKKRVSTGDYRDYKRGEFTTTRKIIEKK